MLSGKTTLIGHIGYPTEAFKAPLIYNPWFEKNGIDAVVVPLGCKFENYSVFLKSFFRLTNVRGALITMPHKVATVDLLDDTSTAVKVAGSSNAILRRDNGTLFGDMFDGAGFVRGVRHKGFQLEGASCLVVGCGGVGSAIAASLAAEGIRALALNDIVTHSAEALAGRLRQHYPRLDVRLTSSDPAGYDLVANCTPLGMEPGDPMPMDVTRLSPTTFVGEVVMTAEMTPFLQAASARGCRFQVGTDMLFEMIPAYLEFFGFGSATVAELRAAAKLT